LGLGRVKNVVRRSVARHRRSGLVKIVHEAAAFFESAWHNEGADFETNGERFVLDRFRSVGFKVAVDVGANVGHWTKAALDRWPDCSVHALEVAPRTFAQLAVNAGTWAHRQRAHLHQCGLSDAAGELTMFFYPDRHELTCDMPRHRDLAVVPFEVEVTTLDRFCAEQGIDRIDYLKIDVEGAEHRVLKGASELLRAGRIGCIQFEYGAFSIDTRIMLRDYFEQLAPTYVIGKIYPDHVAFADYDWTMESFRFSNYLCLSRDRPELRRLVQG
jgi:FkbM family methyltransferase